MSLQAGAGKSVFITGASSGLGRQMAIEFSRRGYRPALTARRLQALKELQPELEKNVAGEVFVAVMDVTDGAPVARVFSQACAPLGLIDIVVANAGVGHHGYVGKLPFYKVRAAHGRFAYCADDKTEVKNQLK